MVNIAESEKARRSMDLFRQGYNCSQAVVGAWADEMGMDFETAIKVSSGFGGGMGRLREVCGSVSGAFMVLGMKYSTGLPDPHSKKAMYEKIQAFAARFKEENKFNSIVCRDILGLTGESKPTPAERTEEYYKKRPCPKLIALSSALLEEFM